MSKAKTNSTQKKSLKERVKTSSDNVKAAYGIGYALGWDDCYKIPNSFGTRYAATYGFSKGIKYRKRSDKYVKQRRKVK